MGKARLGRNAHPSQRYKLLPAFDKSDARGPARAGVRRVRTNPAREHPRTMMDRRDFLKSTGTLIAATAVAQGLPSAEVAAETAPTAKGRVVLPINRRWLYSPKATP